MNENIREQMNIVVVGHVDHGKSTVIGRLLADTGSLPQGKLDQVKKSCERNARPFEYAFLLDALKDEQAQGITIDTARCFFKTETRDYIIIDAPGHVEFLKNMISGAARAEAALLVIDAHEGIQENSKRHGYLLSMLGIPQVIVLVNKMDLVNYEQNAFLSVVSEYNSFLNKLGVVSTAYIPVSARNGENLKFRSGNMGWYTGSTVLEYINSFKKQCDDYQKDFRMPVQDVYKFTAANDDRRIIAGTIETGQINVGDRVTFMPSGKTSTIVSIEGFNCPIRQSIGCGYAAGFTLKDELYVQRGEVICKSTEQHSLTGTRFKANIFWMGSNAFEKNKNYKIKIAAARTRVRLVDVLSCIDASELTHVQGKRQVDRHDVAECILETSRPVAFDTIDKIQALGRFVIVDGYDIAGGGIITESLQTQQSDSAGNVLHSYNSLDTGYVQEFDRELLFGHKSKFIIISGDERAVSVAKQLEKILIRSKKAAYYFGLQGESGAVVSDELEGLEELVTRIGEYGRILTGAGVICITAMKYIDIQILNLLSKLTFPAELLHYSVNGNTHGEDIELADNIAEKVNKVVEINSKVSSFAKLEMNLTE